MGFSDLLYQFIDGQTHYDMPRSAKKKFGPNEPI